MEGKTAIATFGGGCFWCTEAVFLQLQGVRSVVSGYSGGAEENPTYEQVCSKQTGHAEVIQLVYDPALVSYAELLDVYFHTHDPTTIDRQGNDVGPQYRSVIFYHDEEQHQTAARVKEDLDGSGEFSGSIVTAIEPFAVFYPAEEYHQDYFARNPRQPYCAMVVAPKVEKARVRYSEKLADR